ncbi:MAG TPA: PilT/PilU family type 4a pilus ATPase [Gammaproteobacteria bacterium]|jgi:twitching motility protein PilT|nr:PilT/PilU family type 4a pilus ATPase [Gammaproteobacteria bacterium]
MTLISLLATSVQQKASDLHLSAGAVPLMRVSGDLCVIPNCALLTPDTAKQIIYEMLTTDQQLLLEEKRDIDFAISVPDLAHFRANVFYQRLGLSANFRVIPRAVPNIEDLHLPGCLKEWVNISHGLIVVAGATGSGKSTTLAALIAHLNAHRALHIVTIEDPIEFCHVSEKSLVHQRQVGRDASDYPSALRAALREDPDLILIGEMRDVETMRLALTAAETGHVVMTTLHTASAPRTINRIIDVFPAGEKEWVRAMLSDSLEAVICQRLVKTEQGGRRAIFELMRKTPAISHLIRENKISQIYNVMQTNAAVGMCTFSND